MSEGTLDSAAISAGFLPDQRWVSLYPHSGLQWFVPSRTRKDAMAGLRIHRPMKRSARLAWETVRIAAFFGAFKLLAPRKVPSEVIEAVQPFIPTGGTLAASQAIHRARWNVLLITADGEPEAVAKVAMDDVGIEKLRLEAAATRAVAHSCRAPLRPPRIVATAQGVLVLEAIQWKRRVSPWRLPEEVAESLGALFERTGGRQQGTGRIHGDFVPWNLYKTADGWVLGDWEDSQPDGSAYDDIFHYVVQTFAVLKRPSGSEIVEGLGGKGRTGRALMAFGRGAGRSFDEADIRSRFESYLHASLKRFPPDAAGSEPCRRAREELIPILGAVKH